jgi:hypothetical protein
MIVIDAKKGDWSGIAPERCAICHIARIARAMSAAGAEPIHSLASHGGQNSKRWRRDDGFQKAIDRRGSSRSGRDGMRGA